MSQTSDAHAVNELSDTPVRRVACFFALAVTGCLADLLSKSVVFTWLGPPNGTENIYWLMEGYVGIETALNRGALFGMGEGKVWLFACLSFVALGGILFWLFRKSNQNDWLLTITLGIVTGGILGNLYDRLGLWSEFKVFAVRDWIRLSYQYDGYVWPNFNIADSLLVCGAALLVWHSFTTPEAPSNAS